MRKETSHIPEVENFVKSVLADKKADGTQTVHIENMTINNNTPGTSASIGGNVKRVHIPAGIVYALIAATIVIIGIFVFFAITSQKIISKDMYDSVAADVQIVAQCEGKTTNKIYSELRKKYGYKSTKQMPLSRYDDVKAELESRKCDIDIP